MTEQIELKFTVQNHVAKRDELPDPKNVPYVRRCKHMRPLSLAVFYYFHIPDIKFRALLCYKCVCHFRKYKGTFFLASDPIVSPLMFPSEGLTVLTIK